MHRILIVLAAVLMLLANFSGVVFAQTYSSSCSSLVVDDAKVLGNKLKDVQTSAQSLQDTVRTNGTVRVLVSGNTGANIDTFLSNQQGRCPDWNKTNTLGIIIGANNNNPSAMRSLVVAGGKNGNFWASSLDATATKNIRETQINASLLNVKANNKPDDNATAYATALQNGLNQLKSRAQLQLGATVNGGSNALSAPTTQTVVQNSPANFTPVMIGLAVIVLLVVGFFVFHGWNSSRASARQSQDDNSTARQGAISAKSEAVDNVSGLDRKGEALKSKAQALQSKVPADVYQRLMARVTEAVNAADDVAIAFGRLSRDSDPSTVGQPTGTYQTMERAWSNLNQRGTAANRDIQKVTRDCETLESDPTATLSAPPPQPQPQARPAQAAYIRPPQPPTPPAPPVAPVSSPSGGYQSSGRRRRGEDEAEDAVDDAQGLLDQAQEYVREHQRYVSWDTKRELQTAARSLQTAKTQWNDREKARQARSVRTRAENLLDQARSEHRRRYDYSRDSGYYDLDNNWASGPTIIVVDSGYHDRDILVVHDEPRSNGRQDVYRESEAVSGGSIYSGRQEEAVSGGGIGDGVQPEAVSGGDIYSGGQEESASGGDIGGGSDTGSSNDSSSE